MHRKRQASSEPGRSSRRHRTDYRDHPDYRDADDRIDFTETLPYEIQERIGDYLAAGGVAALGRLASANRTGRDVHRRTLLREYDRQNPGRRQEFFDAFALLAPLVSTQEDDWLEDLKDQVIYHYSDPDEREYAKLLRSKGITPRDVGPALRLLELRAPPGTLLDVFDRRGRRVDSVPVSGLRLGRVFDLFRRFPVAESFEQFGLRDGS